MFEKLLYSTHLVRCIIIGPSECGKLVFLTSLIWKIINEYDKIYIYWPSLHQDLYHKLIKCFNNSIPINIIPNILHEEDIDLIIHEICNDKKFLKSDIEIETYESIEELKFHQEYVGGILILDDLNEQEVNDPRVQAKFRRCRHNNLSIFVISQDYYELPRKTIRANGNIYHTFRTNNFLDVRNDYQDKVLWIWHSTNSKF